MLRRRSRVWLVLAGVACLFSAAAACSDDDASPPTQGFDSGIDPDATGSAGICPTDPPGAGATCTLPEGTTCSFDGCGTVIAECRAGAWRYGGNLPPRPLCPEPEPPSSESMCPPCWPATATCTYGSCSGDASTNTAVASCANGQWRLAFTPCSDGGSDVQGDASADAD